jgi:hypothetical protein
VYTFSLISDGGFDMAVSNDAVEITDYRGDAKEIAIPAQINGLPVTAIGVYAFFGNQLTSVTIPNSVTTIGGSAFRENQLTSITIGANVAFEGEPITGNFNTVYTKANKAAGTYRSGDNGATWISYLIY